VATLTFGATDRKIFNPISSALANLPNGAGTMIVLVKKTVLGATDYCGLLLGASSDWYHTLAHQAGDNLWDDDGLAGVAASAAATDDTTNWWFYAVDWPASAGTERWHWRNQTTLGSWTHSSSAGNDGGLRAGPTTAAGWFHIGYSGDGSTATKLQAVCAVWAGTRFADADYGSWSKTSDLYNHALGHPTLLVELNTATPSDISGTSTYSSANSTGTSLTGGDPDNWTFDGVGDSVFLPRRELIVPNQAVIRAGSWW
jgi:hypothetical protein